jgi:HD-GYP domain-containing protein (c-di-GMP phosphodiesterase class II)
MEKRRQAEEEIRKHLVELEAVNRISTALRAAQTLDEMLPHLLGETLAVLSCESGAIWLYDPASGSLRRSAATGVFTKMTPETIQPGEGITGLVFTTGVSYVSPEFHSDPRTRPEIRAQIPAGWGGACIPIRTAKETVGILYVAVQVPRRLSLDEVNLLATLAEIAGNSIHRMSLHVQTERRLERISALHAIDNAISGSLDLGFILDVFLGQVIDQLNVDAAAVLLLNAHSHRLEYAASRGFRVTSPKNLRLGLGEGLAGRAAMERVTRRIADIRLEAVEELHQPQLSLFRSEGFVAYFGVPVVAKGKVKGLLEVFHRSPLATDAEWIDFLETLAGEAAIAIDNAALFEDLQASNFLLNHAYDTTLEGWSRALELRHSETDGHAQRMVDLTLQMARAVGFSESDLIHVRRGTLLHDIGKMGIPDGILLKPGPLTEEEWAVMRLHPVYAYRLLAPITYLRPVLDIPYCHHEKWDGTGYPQGLAKEEIPLSARIFSLVDVWDALLSDRPYRPAWTRESVLDYIHARAGEQFDPRLTPVFIDLVCNSRTP